MTIHSARTTPAVAGSATVATGPQFTSDIGLALLRIGFGALLAVNGSQKLFGWFNGYGWSGTAAGFEGLGYKPGKFFGTLAGLTELGGGVLLILGLLTPLAAAAAIGVTLNAVIAEWDVGFGKGWELPFTYLIAGVALAFTGPGRWSVDQGRPWQRQGLPWALAALSLAVVASIVTLILKHTVS